MQIGDFIRVKFPKDNQAYFAEVKKVLPGEEIECRFVHSGSVYTFKKYSDSLEVVETTGAFKPGTRTNDVILYEKTDEQVFFGSNVGVTFDDGKSYLGRAEKTRPTLDIKFLHSGNSYSIDKDNIAHRAGGMYDGRKVLDRNTFGPGKSLFSSDAARDTGAETLGGFVLPRKLEWPAGFIGVNYIATSFRDEYNLRLDQAVFAGGTAMVAGGQLMGLATGASTTEIEKAKLRTLGDPIARISQEVKTEDGRKSVADAILIVATSVATEIAAGLDSLIVSRANSPAGGDTRYPVVCEYMSRRVGMFLGWVDASLLNATEDEAERIDFLMNQWSALEAGLGMLELPPGVGPIVSAVLILLRPDWEGQFADFKSALKVFRESFNTLAREVLKELLFTKVPEDERTTFSHPEIPRYAGLHGVFVLGGWDEELRFLGLRA